MLSFAFSEEQELFRQMVREFVASEIAPNYLQRARLDHIPQEIIDKIADMGLAGLTISPEYGGQGGGYVTAGIAVEEMSKGDLSCAFFLAGSGPLEKFGTKAQKEEWLPQLAQAKKIVGIAITEPASGSDAAALKTTAIRDGDDYILNGEKTSLSLLTMADAYYLFAKTDPKAGPRGVSCFLVPLDLPGISRSIFHDMGSRPLGRGALTLRDVRVPASLLIGVENRGFHLVMGEFDCIRVFLSLMCLGTAQAALADAAAYAKERKAFGRPIAQFEGVSFLIAEHATTLEAARLLCYKALWMRDQGIPHTKESAMCKWWVPKVSVEAVQDALLIHGHLGYSDEYPQEQRLRDVVGFELADGTAQIMKVIISREIIGREYLPY